MKSLKYLLVPALCIILFSILIPAESACGQSSKLYVIDCLVADEITNIDEATPSDKVYYLPDTGNPLSLIAAELRKGTYSEVHLYLLTKPGSMVFDEIVILADNVDEYSSLLSEWKGLLPSGATIIIHSDTLTSVPEGLTITEKISDYTGATVTVQN